MKWIDIPACRILEITWIEANEQFECLGENGEPCRGFQPIYRMIRKSDSRIFKPAHLMLAVGKNKDVVYLEEL